MADIIKGVLYVHGPDAPLVCIRNTVNNIVLQLQNNVLSKQVGAKSMHGIGEVSIIFIVGGQGILRLMF